MANSGTEEKSAVFPLWVLFASVMLILIAQYSHYVSVKGSVERIQAARSATDIVLYELRDRQNDERGVQSQ